MKVQYIFIFLLICFKLFPQEKFDLKNNQLINSNINQPVDLILNYKTQTPLEIDLGAEINFKGKTFFLPAFFNGEDEFVIRFNGESVGEATIKTISSIPILNGIETIIKINPSRNSQIHPKIELDSKNKSKFIYSDGKPYFSLAFELDWFFALDYNQNDLIQSKKILNQIKNNGFNQLVMNIYAYNVGWPIDPNTPELYNFSKPNYSIFQGDNINPNFKELNYEFFQNLDRKIELLNEFGIVSHLMIYVWNKKVNWPEMYSKEDNLFFDYIIKRYQAYPNIIWDVSKEALDYGRCDINYINERIERINKIDAYEHLITVHDYEYCSREPGRIDFISIQNWRSDLFSNSIDASLIYPNKPIVNIEHGGYEKGPFYNFHGNYTDPKICLERNYQAIFAGLYSSYYWQNSSWNVIVYDIFETDYEKPKFHYYKILKQLFEEYNFNELVANKPKLTTNGRLEKNNLSTSGFCLTNNNGLYLYYIPKENEFVNIVIHRPNSGKLEVTYLNIFTGEKIKEIVKYENFKTFKSPWENESFILILK